MTDLFFWEKPGCGGNARQRAALLAAGHTLERRDLLTTDWTAESLAPFLAGLPVSEWFNRAAPRIKSGEIDPAALDPSLALALLLAEPLLIRRPLMQRRDTGRRHVGFEQAAVETWLGAPLASVPAGRPALDTCVTPARPCPTPVVTGDHHADV